MVRTDNKTTQLITKAKAQALRARTPEERFRWLILQAVAEGRLAMASMKPRQSKLKRVA